MRFTVTLLALALAGCGKTTWTELPAQEVRIGIELRGVSHLNEYYRALRVTRGGREVRLDLMSDWGPADRVGVYETIDGNLGIIQALAIPTTIELRPLREATQNTDVETWRYLGAFDMIRVYADEAAFVSRGAPSQLEFIPASVQEECIPMLGGGPRPDVRVAHQMPDFCGSVELVASTRRWITQAE